MLTKARLAIFSLFLIHGLIVSTWASRLPLIQQRLGIGPGQLGLLLLASAIGALLAMPLTGKLLGRFGSKPVALVSSIAFCLSLPLLALAEQPVWLAVVLFFFGLSAGVMDVSMNAQAVHLEKLYQRSLMVAFHALFSAGGLLGAVIGSLLAARGLTPEVHFASASLCYVLGVGVASMFLLSDKPDRREKKALFAPFSMRLVGLCVIGFCCFLSEGAIIDWSGVYLYRALKTTEAVAALGYAFFSVTMTGGRFVGDALTERFGARQMVLIGSLLAAVGMVVVLASPVTVYALGGFALAGAGFSVVVPLVFSASGRMGGNSHSNLTTITLFSYSAFLLGPPLIGFLAEALDLRLALMLIVALACLSALFSRIAFPAVDGKAD